MVRMRKVREDSLKVSEDSLKVSEDSLKVSEDSLAQIQVHRCIFATEKFGYVALLRLKIEVQAQLCDQAKKLCN